MIPDLICKPPANGSQCHTLLAAFMRGERLTVGVALEKYGIYALSQRCGELKRQGWPIVSAMKDLGTKRVAEYWME